MENKINNLSIRVAELAEQASRNGTFGVGGILIDDLGNIITEMKNQVLRNGRVNDPTAHVERQIVDWYFEAKKKNHPLPEPHRMTIISSLDPCMMCAGSILAAKFNVVSLNFDDMAGVNFDGLNTFDTLPKPLKIRAARTFGYCEHSLKPQGTAPYFLSPTIVDKTTRDRAFKAFFNNLTQIREQISCANHAIPGYSQIMDNLAAGVSQASLLEKIREYSPYFLLLRGIDSSRVPDELGDILISEAKSASLKGAKMNAAALIDSCGNLLMVTAGDEQISPIRSAFMQLMRNYAQMRSSMAENRILSLPAPRDCFTILLKGPGLDASDIADLGAFGSAMEGAMDDDFEHLQYIVPSQSPRSLNHMMDRFPPLYRDIIGVRPTGIQNAALVRRCVAALK